MPDVHRPFFHRVGVYARPGLREATPVVTDLLDWLASRGVEVVLETETARLAAAEGRVPTAPQAALPTRVDLIVVLGGDGTLLSMADRIAEAGADVPILGVNFGSLGFLTEVTLDELRPALDAALVGAAPVDSRLMLHARVLRGDATVAQHLVLNDVVVGRGARSSIIDLAVSVGPEFVTSVRADGLIVASPTGSTAYNLAAGGPIVHPRVEAIVLTPIAPHTLTNRPVVIPAAAEVRIWSTTARDGEVVVNFDGHAGVILERDDIVSIQPAPRALRLLRPSTRTYFEVLRQKLKWGER